jgi:uridine kinase
MGFSSILIGIAGGTGSGKTSIANYLLNEYGKNEIIVIQQDSYYQDNSNLSIQERNQQNYDHPEAFDLELFNQQLIRLLKGEDIDIPVYDFSIHNRSLKKKKISPSPIIIIEGILILYFESLRKLMNIKIFVDTPDETRFNRRILRDVKKRGRTIKSVTDQYINTVRPMHQKYVEPSKDFADIIISNGIQNKIAIGTLINKINTLLLQYDSRP